MPPKGKKREQLEKEQKVRAEKREKDRLERERKEKEKKDRAQVAASFSRSKLGGLQGSFDPGKNVHTLTTRGA